MAMKTVGWIASIILFVFLLGVLAVVCYYFPTLSSQPRFERIIDCRDSRAEDYYDDYFVGRNSKPLPPIKNISDVLRTRTLKISTLRTKLSLVTPSIGKKLINTKNPTEFIKKKTGEKSDSTFSTSHETNLSINNEHKEKIIPINKGPYFSPASPLKYEDFIVNSPKPLVTFPKTIVEHNINDNITVNKNSSKLHSILQSTNNPISVDENLEDGKNKVLGIFESMQKETLFPGYAAGKLIAEHATIYGN